VPAAIQNNFPSLFDALFDEQLDAQFLLGNHDYDLFQWVRFAPWQRYFFLSPSVMLLHGDIFDWVERLPDSLQQFFVHLFAPGVKPGKIDLQRMRPLNEQMRASARIDGTVRRLLRSAPLNGTPEFFNVQKAGQADAAMLTFLKEAREQCAQADRQFGTSLKVAVIGHTHHARIAVQETGDDLFTLIDCGAWIEECVAEDFDGALPNAQIAALGANEARIYQMIAR
jgi:UDP-2,3-diacylglucosamine pyrophosphatase LpxH